jgi:Cu/Ag efflux protein CusF
MRHRSIYLSRLWILGFAIGLASVFAPLTGGLAQQTHRYEFKGTIKTVNKSQKTAVIRHERVGNYMEPMTMPFFIRDEKALAALEPRDQIVATLVVTKKDGEWLEDVVVVAKGR